MLIFLFLKTKQPFFQFHLLPRPFIAKPPKRVVWRNSSNNFSLPILSLNPFQSSFSLWHSKDTNIHRVTNGMVNPSPYFLIHCCVSHSGYSSVPAPSSLGFQGHWTSLFFFPILVSSAGSFSFPDLCPGNSSRCHWHSFDDHIQCHSFRKNFLLRTSKCTNAAQALSHQAAHLSSCSPLLPLRHPACVQNRTCLTLNTQSSPRTCLPIVFLFIPVKGDSIFPKAQAEPGTHHDFFFLSLYIWSTSRTPGSCLASPITALFQATILSRLVCENLHLIGLLSPTLDTWIWHYSRGDLFQT